MTEQVKGYEARTIDELGDGNVFDYRRNVEYMVSGSSSQRGGAASYAGRLTTLEEAKAHRDRIAALPEESARYDIFEIVELTWIIRHRVVDTIHKPLMDDAQ